MHTPLSACVLCVFVCGCGTHTESATGIDQMCNTRARWATDGARTREAHFHFQALTKWFNNNTCTRRWRSHNNNINIHPSICICARGVLRVSAVRALMSSRDGNKKLASLRCCAALCFILLALCMCVGIRGVTHKSHLRPWVRVRIGAATQKANN